MSPVKKTHEAVDSLVDILVVDSIPFTKGIINDSKTTHAPYHTHEAIKPSSDKDLAEPIMIHLLGGIPSRQVKYQVVNREHVCANESGHISLDVRV